MRGCLRITGRPSELIFKIPEIFSDTRMAPHCRQCLRSGNNLLKIPCLTFHKFSSRSGPFLLLHSAPYLFDNCVLLLLGLGKCLRQSLWSICNRTRSPFMITVPSEMVLAQAIISLRHCKLSFLTISSCSARIVWRGLFFNVAFRDSAVIAETEDCVVEFFFDGFWVLVTGVL